MTADEFRKMLDRFHEGLKDALRWKNDHVSLKGIDPWWHEELDKVWRDLNRECALMKDAEGPLDTAVQPTHPVTGLPRVPTPAEVNAEAIGTLQAKVARLEGLVKAMEKRIREVAATAAEGLEATAEYEPMRVSKTMERLAGPVLADGSVPE